MLSITIGLQEPDTRPTADVLTLDATSSVNAGEHFITIHLGGQAKVITPGTNEVAVAYARALAAAATEAADAVEAKMRASATVPVEA